MIGADAILEYSFTIGISLAFAGFFIALYLSRNDILAVFKKRGLDKRTLLAILVVALIFLGLELILVKPTQQLFFDDMIYQAMGQQLLHTGQAWMCNYGTPTACFIGEIFHEPMGTSFNLAIGFAILGIRQYVGYLVMLVLTFISVIAVGIIGVLLFDDRKAGVFAALIFGVCPLVMTWAFPTTSDIPTTAYSFIAIIALLVFIWRKNYRTLALLIFSIGILTYMKVYALVYLPIFAILYLVLNEGSMKRSLINGLRTFYDKLLDKKSLLLIAMFLIIVVPNVYLAIGKFSSDSYGAQGSVLYKSCSSGPYSPTEKFGVQIFEANICTNLGYWFDTLGSDGLIFPLSFTVLALVGVVGLLFIDRRALLAVGIWLLAIFLLYTAFYAGAVNYGVDVRFMLGVVGQVALFAGYGMSFLSNLPVLVSGKKRNGRTNREARRRFLVLSALIIFLLLEIVAYSFYRTVPTISVNPSTIAQAADARTYENFVYASANSIPSTCLVFTYDPTLFNLVNRSAAQFGYIYNSSFVSNASRSYSCGVIDYGYWCYTPGNICSGALGEFPTTMIASTKGNLDSQFALYEIPLDNSST